MMQSDNNDNDIMTGPNKAGASEKKKVFFFSLVLVYINPKLFHYLYEA